MGLAVDTVAAFKTNPGAAAVAAAAFAGDSLVVRAYGSPATCYLETLVRQGAAAGVVGLRSPLMHDPVTGIRAARAAGLTASTLPRDMEQQLNSNDTLIAELSGGAAETDAMAFALYYTDLRGASADLRMPGDIAGNVKSIKSVPVTGATAAAGVGWTDKALNSTEDLLHANKLYACLGYLTDTAMLAIGVKGSATANLRNCGPGLTDGTDTSEFFVRQSEKTGRPHVPVFNASDRASTFVSYIDAAGGTTPLITLIVAELVS